MKLVGMKGCAQVEKRLKGAKILDVLQLPKIPFNIGLNIGLFGGHHTYLLTWSAKVIDHSGHGQNRQDLRAALSSSRDPVLQPPAAALFFPDDD